MPRYYTPQFLRKLRNDIPIEKLIGEVLEIPHKYSEGYLRFLCPICSDFHTATNVRTNLARCFRCKKNFNPIDLVMVENNLNFKESVTVLNNLFFGQNNVKQFRDFRAKESRS
ncbi:MAG: hypothetical protein GY941_03275 [Planctomycetes bacterium]|nr:hypothetical protein [Planctomycetota bacterium]